MYISLYIYIHGRDKSIYQHDVIDLVLLSHMFNTMPDMPCLLHEFDPPDPIVKTGRINHDAVLMSIDEYFVRPVCCNFGSHCQLIGRPQSP